MDPLCISLKRFLEKRVRERRERERERDGM